MPHLLMFAYIWQKAKIDFAKIYDCDKGGKCRICLKSATVGKRGDNMLVFDKFAGQ